MKTVLHLDPNVPILLHNCFIVMEQLSSFKHGALLTCSKGATSIISSDLCPGIGRTEHSGKSERNRLRKEMTSRCAKQCTAGSLSEAA